MSDRDPAIVRQIAHALRRMKRYVGERSIEEFVVDQMAVDAAIRTLEIVSEASRRLSDEVKDRHPHVPWVLIAGASTVYRNDCDEINAERMYHTATTEIASLVQALANEGLKLPE